MSVGQKDRLIRSALPEGEQCDLEWFYGYGQVAFERSTFGAQLARQALFTFGTRMCPGCKGSGFPGNADEALRKAIAAAKEWEAGMGKSLAAELRDYRNLHGRRASPKWYDDGTCRQCHGSGWVPRTDRMRLARVAWCMRCGEPEDDAVENSVCPTCGGDWTRRAARVTAQSTGTEVRLLGEPYGDDLERYGSVSKRLGTMQPDYSDTFQGFFGIGQRWADDKYFGQIFGVMPLTLAGRELLELSRSKTKNEDTLPDDFVLATEAELNRVQRKKTRTELLEKARDQGESLLRSAEDEWPSDEPRQQQVADKPKEAKPPTPEKHERIRVRELRLDGIRRSLRIIELRMHGGS